MTRSAGSFTADIQDAVDASLVARTRELCSELIAFIHAEDDLFPADEGERVLKHLRKKRFFELMSDVAEALLESGQRHPNIQIQYAQALIDRGLPWAAEVMLQPLLGATEDPRQLRNAEGTLGRALKQMYLERGKSDLLGVELLTGAIDSYHRSYARNPAVASWQGINAVALLARARRDGVDTAGYPEPEAIAAEILEAIESGHRDPDVTLSAWDLATAAEACVALGRTEDAAAWIHRYVARSSELDAFGMAATARQFTAVWQLDLNRDPGASLLPPLAEHTLQRNEGSKIDITTSSLDHLERFLGEKGLVSHSWFLKALTRSRFVARITDRDGEHIGTGFLVAATDLDPSITSTDVVLLTNSHVISDDPENRRAIFPDEALVLFQSREVEDAFEVQSVIWSSPPQELDVSVLQLEGFSTDELPTRIYRRLPRPDGNQPVYIIGHPGGDDLHYSIEDNDFLDHDDRLLHYRAPTEPGSSGSPVYNSDWKLIGIHHAGSFRTKRLTGDGTYEANEGIRLTAIQEAIREALGD